jgi:hypothetical protein
VIDAVMAANPKQLADYRSGKDKLFGFFVGQVMKATGGKANPAQLNDLLKAKLGGGPLDARPRFAASLSCSSNFPIRGHLVHLDASWRALIEHREYPGGHPRYPWARRRWPRCCWRPPSNSRACCRCNCRATGRCI